jgi:hypothetical protein
MQKLITVAINLEKLRGNAQGTFTVTDVEEINALLQEGWIIEEYEFLSGGEEDEQAVVLFILNDGAVDAEFSLTDDEIEEDDESLSEEDAKNEDGDEEPEDEDEISRTHADAPMI